MSTQKNFRVAFFCFLFFSHAPPKFWVTTFEFSTFERQPFLSNERTFENHFWNKNKRNFTKKENKRRQRSQIWRHEDSLQKIFISWKKFQDCSSTNNVHGLNELQTEWSDDYRLSTDKKKLLVLNRIVLNDFVFMKGSHYLESTELSVESSNPC